MPRHKIVMQAVNISDCILHYCSVLGMIHDIIRMVIFNASFAIVAKELFLSLLDFKRWIPQDSSAKIFDSDLLYKSSYKSKSFWYVALITIC
jgi:hypothetical protein